MTEIKTAEQRIHKLEGGEGDSFVTFEQALIAGRNELRAALADRDARLAALEHWNKHYTTIECPQCGFAGGREHAAAGAAPNAWKDAILDVMTIYGMDAPTTDAPEKIIKDLIELATRVAIDPTIAAGAAPVPCVVLTPEERAAFERFHETWEDNEGYDVPKEMMRRLAEVGVVHHITAGRYDITKFGHYVLAAGAAPVPDGYRLVSIAQLNTWGVYDEETTPKDAP